MTVKNDEVLRKIEQIEKKMTTILQRKEPEKFMSVRKASEYFGIEKNRFYELMRTDPTIPKLKIGSKFKVNTDLLMDWLNEKTRRGEAI